MLRAKALDIGQVDRNLVQRSGARQLQPLGRHRHLHFGRAQHPARHQRGRGKVDDPAGHDEADIRQGDALGQRQDQRGAQLGPATAQVDRLPGLGKEAEGRLVQKRQRRRQGRGCHQFDLRRRGALRDVCDLKDRAVRLDPPPFRRQHMAPVKHDRIGHVVQRGMAAGLQHRGQRADKADLGFREFVSQRQLRGRSGGKAQRGVHVAQPPLADILGKPCAGARHDRNRPEPRQTVGADLVQRDLQPARPSRLPRLDRTRQQKPLSGLDQGKLADLDPERVEHQPQVKRPFAEADGFLEQALGVDLHLGKADLRHQLARQAARCHGAAIGADQIAMPLRPKAQRGAVQRQRCQLDPRRGRVEAQRQGRAFEGDGLGPLARSKAAGRDVKPCAQVDQASVPVDRGAHFAGKRRIQQGQEGQRRGH